MGVAVAVQASTRARGKAHEQPIDLQVLGAKSCPHSLMQCASSMATSGQFRSAISD
jgi:hypothetical protein